MRGRLTLEEADILYILEKRELAKISVGVKIQCRSMELTGQKWMF